MSKVIAQAIAILLLFVISAFADECPGIYYPYSSHTVNSKPISIFVGDLDGDGDDDIAVACYWREFMSVTFNNGDMTFTWPVWERVRIYTEWIDGADFDNDNDIDIVVANSQNSSVSVLLNHGDGDFAMRSDYTTYGNSRSVCAAYLNDDDYIDLVAANYWNNRISVLMNNGDGTFAAYEDYQYVGNPRGVHAADLDNDGDNDIITANMEQDNISIFENDGYGTFSLSSTRPVGVDPFMVQAADLDGDSDIDLVTANSGDNTISVLINTGYGATFAPQVQYPAGSEPVFVRPVDIDNDSDYDLTVANNSGHTLTTLINNGNGGFDHSTVNAVDYNPYSIACADFNSDGYNDVAIAQFQSNYVSILRNRNSLPFTGSINGLVENHLGEPVAGATITVAETADEAISDSDGTFSFDSLCCTSYSLEISHPDYCDGEITDIRVGPDETTAVNLNLNFMAIGGLITDSAANPIEGVRVSIEGEAQQSYSGIDGRFYFGCVEPGIYSLDFYHPHFTDTVIAGIQPTLNDTASIEIEMAARGFLTGTVTDLQMQPVEGIAVISLHDGIADTTDINGVYRLDYLNSCNHDIYFNSPYYYDTTVTGISILPADTSILNISLLHRPDLEIWYGSLNQYPVTARIGAETSVEMYILTAGPVQIENARFIMGANNQFISGLNSHTEGEILFPFNAMELASFSEPVGAPPNQTGWSSQYLEVAGTMAQSPWFNFTVPTVAARFIISAVNDSELAGDTVACFGYGVDEAGDSSYAEGFGNITFSVKENFGSLYFTSDYPYLPGDANMYLGNWPPQLIGSDVTYLVNYIRGLSQPCSFDGFWASADINGDCLIIGSDVTRLVSYFRDLADISYCPDYPPEWLSESELPVFKPSHWPGCD